MGRFHEGREILAPVRSWKADHISPVRLNNFWFYDFKHFSYLFHLFNLINEIGLILLIRLSLKSWRCNIQEISYFSLGIGGNVLDPDFKLSAIVTQL